MNAVIVSAQRSGGLWLSGCLSNHPDICIPREEPFKGASIWQTRLKLSHTDLLDFIFNQPFYRVCGCRLTYDQILNPEITAYIHDHQVRIIHLIREILPTVTSTLLAKQEMSAGTPRHWFDDSFPDNEILDVTPDQVIQRIKHLIKQRRNFAEHFGGDHLVMRYEEITSLGWMLTRPATVAICDYLEISPVRLTTHHRKMHKRPLRSYYRNWTKIEIELNRCFPDLVVI